MDLSSNNEQNAGSCGVYHVLNGKGGVGKSLVATWLAEFLIRSGRPVCSIDSDPVNRSFSQYRALAAEKLDLVNPDGLIQRERYDALIEQFATSEAVFVVDCGATAFLPFWMYLVEGEVNPGPSGGRRNVYLHIPITGEETLGDTLLGFAAVAEGSKAQEHRHLAQ